MDVVFVLTLIGFFVASWGFLRLCAALEPRQEGKR
jgi:hypothetical protein